MKFYDKKKFYWNFARHISLFIMLKMNFADAEKVKKSFISSILKGETEDKINRKAKLFFEENYPDIFRQNALDFIQNMETYAES